MFNAAKIPFIKMNGLGNDFVIIDERLKTYNFSHEERIKICDRFTGIGCDQLIFLRKSINSEADIFMDMYNFDGSELYTCGNATRCVAHWFGADRTVIETKAGLFECLKNADETITV
jgi:diaminopimelate epimerase